MPRTWTDDDLKQAIEGSTSWRAVQRSLGLKATGPAHWLRRHAQALNIDYSHFRNGRSLHDRARELGPRSDAPLAPGRLPFGQPVSPDGKYGLSVAARWFLERGYPVSVPLEPTRYDLVAESDDGLIRVQVKTTRKQGRNGRYQVKLVRTVYDAEAESNAGGKYRQVPYLPGMVDYFFVIANGGEKLDMYLLPFDAVDGKTSVVLDRKYAAFKVN